MERRKRYAWSIAMECCSKSKEDALTVYQRVMKELNDCYESHKT
jgi:hypothetical protein